VSNPADGTLESDPRFPSGAWTGYFEQKLPLPFPGRFTMEMVLSFRNGTLTGTGRDLIGEFAMDGVYHLQDGRCHWTKRYVGKHEVDYSGFNEGKGIWGVWQILSFGLHGGFHIWPEGLSSPGGDVLSEEADLPRVEEIETEPIGVP